jgi:hypothetical protein
MGKHLLEMGQSKTDLLPVLSGQVNKINCTKNRKITLRLSRLKLWVRFIFLTVNKHAWGRNDFTFYCPLLINTGGELYAP